MELLFELLFALELLFIIRPGAAVHNSPTRGSGVLENALLLRCRDAAVYGAALLQMVCAAGYLLVISACPRAAVCVVASLQRCCCLWSCCL